MVSAAGIAFRRLDSPNAGDYTFVCNADFRVEKHLKPFDKINRIVKCPLQIQRVTRRRHNMGVKERLLLCPFQLLLDLTAGRLCFNTNGARLCKKAPELNITLTCEASSDRNYTRERLYPPDASPSWITVEV